MGTPWGRALGTMEQQMASEEFEALTTALQSAKDILRETVAPEKVAIETVVSAGKQVAGHREGEALGLRDEAEQIPAGGPGGQGG